MNFLLHVPVCLGVAVASSIFTLTAMSIDRYVTIKFPMRSLTGMTTQQAIIVMVVTWLVAAVLMAPLLYVRKVSELF